MTNNRSKLASHSAWAHPIWYFLFSVLITLSHYPWHRIHWPSNENLDLFSIQAMLFHKVWMIIFQFEIWFMNKMPCPVRTEISWQIIDQSWKVILRGLTQSCISYVLCWLPYHTIHDIASIGPQMKTLIYSQFKPCYSTKYEW